MYIVVSFPLGQHISYAIDRLGTFFMYSMKGAKKEAKIQKGGLQLWNGQVKLKPQ